MKDKFCKCGCGEAIIIRPHHKYVGVPDYIRGHSSRCMTKKQLLKRSETAKKRTAEGRNSQFIGCWKGKKRTDEQKKKQSEIMKGRFLGKKRPRHRLKMIKLAQQNEKWGMRDPVFRKKALEKRQDGFSSGKNNGRYIDGRKSKPGYGAVLAATRRARKFNQTPVDADQKKIALLYELAKMVSIITGDQYDVDHIIPLSKGGLHHENNLRVITHKENVRKYNKIIPFQAKVINQ